MENLLISLSKPEKPHTLACIIRVQTYNLPGAQMKTILTKLKNFVLIRQAYRVMIQFTGI